MYRSLYGFRSTEPNSLAFGAGETFLLLERSNQHWWLVSRAGSGETGYAPASYLQRLQICQEGAPYRSVAVHVCVIAAHADVISSRTTIFGKEKGEVWCGTEFAILEYLGAC
uniref:Uncharacterized protein n=1 Tax=Sphaerodactylus townsendi TaxID=933632 RepID=A0ACB8EHL4_9SAUR